MPHPLAPDGPSGATGAPPFHPAPQLGVLLVRGIGEQKRGETAIPRRYPCS